MLVMQNQKHKEFREEGVAIPTIIVFGLLSIGYAILWIAFAKNILNAWLTALIGSLLAYGMFTVAHEASHSNISGGITKFTLLDTCLGWFSATTLFFPYTAFKIIHLQHHAHTNDPEQDPDDYVKGKNALDIFFRCLTLVFYYFVQALGRQSHHNVAMQKCRSHTLMFLVFLFGLITLLITLGMGKVYFFVFVLPALIVAPFLGFTFDWLPHYPHHNMGKHLNTRIVTIPGLELLFYYQNYHLIHHLHPRIPFYRYKAKFKEIETHLLERDAPIEGWRNKDRKLFYRQNTYHDLKKGQIWQYALEVLQLKNLTHNAKTIRFKNVASLPFKYKAGQYVVVTKQVNYHKVSRCYSICSSPDSGDLIIGVKRVTNGIFSNSLLDTLKEGQSLNVAGPFGEFNLKENATEHIFIAGGSGITPIFSMIRYAVKRNKPCKLIYGCRSAKDVMFNTELQQLVIMSASLFKLEITFDLLTVANQIQLLGKITAGAVFYLCGPGPMMKASRKALSQLKVSADSIVTEDFEIENKPLSGAKFTVHSSRSRTFEAYKSETILEASKRNNMTLPHACGMGQCGTCKVKLKSGKIVWKSTQQTALLNNEKEAGYILTCMCYAQSVLELED